MGSVESHSSESNSESLPRNSELDPESLLNSAAEIVARQRLAEELEEGTSTEREEGPSFSGSSGESSSRSRPRRSTQIAANTQTAARRSHFSTIGELLQDLLENNDLRLDNWWHTQENNLNMAAGNDEEISSDDDEFMEANQCPKRFADQGIFTISEDKTSQKSYFDMINDVSLRCGYCNKPIQNVPKDAQNDDQNDASTPTCTKSTSKPPISSIPSFLLSRELGFNRLQTPKTPASFLSRPYIGSFTCGQRVLLNNHFIPNQRRRVDLVKSKTFCVAYTNNGDGLLTASQDHRIRLYKRKGPRRRFMRSRHLEVPYVGWSILDVCVSPDGRNVVYSTWNEAIYQCNIADSNNDDYSWQTLRVNPRESRFSIFSLRFNTDGSEIVAGSTDGMYIYNREVNRCVLGIQAHEDDINAVCFGDHSSHIILSGSDDGLCKVWDRRTMGDFMNDAKPVGVFAGHRDGITYIDSRGDDRYLLTNSKDQTLKIWDLRNFSNETGIDATRRAVANQRWDYRWQCTPDDIFKLTHLPGDSSVLTIRGHSILNTLIRARFSPEHTGKRYIYTGCARGNCIVYDLYSGELLKKYPGHRSVVRDCAWHPVENEIVTSSWDGETSLWRYDERAVRCINPDSNLTGDEDSCNESYEPIRQKCLFRNRFRNIRINKPERKIPTGPLPGSGLKIAKVEKIVDDSSTDEESNDSEGNGRPISYATAAKRGRSNGFNR